MSRKNALDLCGKPLIVWSIEAGMKSKYLDKVVATSNDEGILDVPKLYRVQSIKRPYEVASDTIATFDAIKHTINNIEAHDYIVLLQSIGPFRDEKHIHEAIELLETKNADAIVGICEMEHSLLWSNVLPKDGSINDFLREEILNKRSQDLEK